VAAAPYPAKAPGQPANGRFVPENLKHTGSGEILTAKRVTWIAVIGSIVLIAIGLCLCKLRCLKERKEKKNTERHDIGAYKGSREKLKYTESPVQQNGQMEKGSFVTVHF
jgi:hypothetical protein